MKALCLYELGVIGRPAAAEDVAVARDILLSGMTGGYIHIAHVSSKNTVDMVRRAKAKGLNVTCEVTSQHLSFTDEYLREYNPAFKMAIANSFRRSSSSIIGRFKRWHY